jgi:molecular chaperone GrpE
VSHDPRTAAPPAEPDVLTDDVTEPSAVDADTSSDPAAPIAPDAASERDRATGDAPDGPPAAAVGDENPAGDQNPARDENPTGDAYPAGAPLHDLPGDGPHTELLAAVLADPRSRAELFADLLAAEAKRDEYLDDLRRSHAELENYRKRVLRDAALQRDHGRVDVVAALLESLDDLDRTEQAGADSADEALAKGVALVAAKLRDALATIEVERIDAVGVPFDPTVHEAVQQVPADEPHDEPQVAQVLRAGYRLGERTLRAAMVVVSQ